MPVAVLEKGREYQRFQHTQDEDRFLRRKGLTPVVSSNVSAIAVDEIGLIVRFHGGSTYRYPESGNLYERMLKSSSKGKFVWRELIRKKAPYYRMGAVNIADDIEDRDMMTQVGIEERVDMPDVTTLVTLDNVRTIQYETIPTLVKVEIATPSISTLSAPSILNTLIDSEPLTMGFIAGFALATMIENKNAEEAEK